VRNGQVTDNYKEHNQLTIWQLNRYFFPLMRDRMRKWGSVRGRFLYGLGVTGRHLLVLEKIGLAWYSRVYILGGARFPFRGCRACRGPWGFNWWNKLSFNIPCLLLEIIPALDHFFGWWPGWWVGGGLSVFISNAVSTWPASTWYYAQNTLCWGSWMWHGLIVPMPERMSE
jgi:hypothetical protein